ncbi:MAG: hypothetical protein FIB08_04115 [Candidatus Methanoperedens sp.]|nr:hypothetical protein [Candidatus Methanoperedens sp.]
MKIKNTGILYLIAATILISVLIEAEIIEIAWNSILIRPLGIEISLLWLSVSGIAAGVYLLILAKQYLDAKMSKTKDTEEKYTGIIILVVSLILALLMPSSNTGQLGTITSLTLILPALIIIMDYWSSGLQWAREMTEQYVKQSTAREEEIASRIEQLNELARRIENKAEKLEWIVRKVSD